MVSVWKSVEIELSGRRDGYLVDVKIVGSDEVWWVPDDYIMRLKQPCDASH
jgi:hypothetical protein